MIRLNETKSMKRITPSKALCRSIKNYDWFEKVCSQSYTNRLKFLNSISIDLNKMATVSLNCFI